MSIDIEKLAYIQDVFINKHLQKEKSILHQIKEIEDAFQNLPVFIPAYTTRHREEAYPNYRIFFIWNRRNKILEVSYGNAQSPDEDVLMYRRDVLKDLPYEDLVELEPYLGDFVNFVFETLCNKDNV